MSLAAKVITASLLSFTILTILKQSGALDWSWWLISATVYVPLAIWVGYIAYLVRNDFE